MGIPVIGTSRLVLRPWSERDAFALHRLWTDPAVSHFIWGGDVIEIERATETVREAVLTADSNGVGCWTVGIASAPGSVIGFCGLQFFDDPRRIELVAGLLPQCWGRGFATEACHAALAYAFQQGFDCVYARTAPHNRQSIKMLERLGMKIDASTWIDESPDLSFSLSREEFKRQCRMERQCNDCGVVLSGCAA